MTLARADILPPGDVWNPTHNNGDIPVRYYKELRPVEKPTGALGGFLRTASERALRPGWDFQYALGSEDYLLAVFVYPGRSQTLTSAPNLNELVREEAIAVPFRPGDNYAVLSRRFLNSALDGTNKQFSGRPVALYNELIPDTETRKIWYQSGVALLIAHFQTLDHAIASETRERGKLLDKLIRPGGAFATENIRAQIPKIEERIGELEALRVPEPQTFFD